MHSPSIKRRLCVAAIAASLCSVAPLMAQQSEDAEQSAEQRKNVILIIGDGMDDQQITIARNYLKGARGKLLMDQLPLRSVSQILTQDDEAPSKPVYVADSANSATSMATGISTSRGRIATSAGENRDSHPAHRD